MSHVHDILDTDKRFVIDPETRAISTEYTGKIILMQGDHNSERFTFQLPKMIEGHDMSLSTVAQIHYLNGENPGVYEADDLQVDPEDTEKVIFSWLVSRNATQVSSTLNFLIKLRCYEEETVVYEWNSAVYNKVTVGSGIDNGEAIVEEYTDILAEWESRITALENSESIDLSDYALKTDIPTVPTKVSQLQNDAGYLTEIPEVDLSDYALKTDIPDTSDFLTAIPDEYVTDDELTAKGYLTEHQDLSNYALKTDIPDPSDFLTAIPDEYVTDDELTAKGYLTEHQDLSNYALKTDIPTVPTKVSELENDVGYLTEADITYGTDDLEAGVSELETGTLYFVYE